MPCRQHRLVGEKRLASRAGRGKAQWGAGAMGLTDMAARHSCSNEQGLRSRFELPIPDAIMVYRIAPSGHTTSHGSCCRARSVCLDPRHLFSLLPSLLQ